MWKNTNCYFVELRRSLWRAYSLGHDKRDLYAPCIPRALLLFSYYTVHSRATSKAFRLKNCSFVPSLWYLISVRKTKIFPQNLSNKLRLTRCVILCPTALCLRLLEAWLLIFDKQAEILCYNVKLDCTLKCKEASNNSLNNICFEI